MRPKLIVEQKITAFANQYRIFSVDSNGDKSEMIAYAQQKRLAFKEKVTFYSGEKKSQEVFGFRAEKVVDIHGKYFVEDPDGQHIGTFKKDFTSSLTNSTWQILDKQDQPKIIINESNSTLAILRRFVGFIPFVGDLAEIIIILFKYHFVFTDISSGEVVGKYQKTKLLRDHYLLLMTDEGYKNQDWRVISAMAVALDALQSR